MLTLEKYIKKNIYRYLKIMWKSVSVEMNLESMKYEDLQEIILDYMDYQNEWEENTNE